MSDEELQRLRRICILEPSIENLARLGAAYIRATSIKHTVKFVGRRWFNSGKGHTYHAVDVYVDGVLILASTILTGYGDQYIESGFAILAKLRPDIPVRLIHHNGSPERIDEWEERTGIKFERLVTDVKRKRDL